MSLMPAFRACSVTAGASLLLTLPPPSACLNFPLAWGHRPRARLTPASGQLSCGSGACWAWNHVRWPVVAWLAGGRADHSRFPFSSGAGMGDAWSGLPEVPQQCCGAAPRHGALSTTALPVPVAPGQQEGHAVRTSDHENFAFWA